MSKPVIGVAFAGPDYLSALRNAKAEVHQLRPDTDPLATALDRLDGLLLTGGPDVRPSLYRASSTHDTVEIDAERDSYELPLAKAALARGLPLLAICRGMQVLNVAAGGTLIQDLPSERPSDTPHDIPLPKNAIAHRVHVTAGSRLEGLVKNRFTAEGDLQVNSRHHQAIDTVAAGFIVSATAPDGIIEAFEHTALPFCIGVQWHPENFWRTGDFAALFLELVRASQGLSSNSC